jgi:hypothetical protein
VYRLRMYKWLGAPVAVTLLVVGWAAPAGTCLTIDRPVTRAEIDENARASLQRLPELFEGEIIVDNARRGLRITRVFRGQLQPGTILWADPGAIVLHTCGREPARAGDRGILMVGFGPRGPSYVDSFISEATVASLQRSGALPPR